MRRAFLSLAALALFITASRAADWQPITTALLAQEKTGYGGLCGVVVDHATGQIIVNLSDRGTFTSSDHCGPKELKGIGGLTWLEYDPKNDVLYIMKMGTELFAMQRR